MRKLFFLPLLVILLLEAYPGYSQDQPVNSSEKLFYPELVTDFYQSRNDSMFWFNKVQHGSLLRKCLLGSLDTAAYYHMLQKKYHYTFVKLWADLEISDSTTALLVDKIFTDALIAAAKDIYQGNLAREQVGYDQLSSAFEKNDNEFILAGLKNCRNDSLLIQWIKSLEPVTAGYTSLKDEFNRQANKRSTDTMQVISEALNAIRWMEHFKFEKRVFINIPATWLQFFEKDSLLFEMKTVVGAPSTPTPRFATVCNQVILYPYWYVPPSIIFNEYLPKIKANPSWLDAHNMQVIDGKGNVLDHLTLNWSSFRKGYFPYSIRQSTGCDNALGVVKFNIVTPFGVYLHDTNNKTAFLSALRFYSHGCIRLEQPMLLGNNFLNGTLDTAFLQSCFKEQKPRVLFPDKPVPVFVLYLRVMADRAGHIRYFRDVYRIKK